MRLPASSFLIDFRSDRSRLSQYLLVNCDGDAWLPDHCGLPVRPLRLGAKARYSARLDSLMGSGLWPLGRNEYTNNFPHLKERPQWMIVYAKAGVWLGTRGRLSWPFQEQPSRELESGFHLRRKAQL